MNVKIIKGVKENFLQVPFNTNVLEMLRSNGFYLPAICSGNGVCGKCAILTSSDFEITTEDKKFFTKEKLDDGFRLACTASIKTDCEITLIHSDESEFNILTSYSNEDCFQDRFLITQLHIENVGRSLSKYLEVLLNGKELPFSIMKSICHEYEKNNNCFILTDEAKALAVYTDENIQAYGVAIDIGTTTIGLEIFDVCNGGRIDSFSLINRQREFGADVISRIVNSESGNLKTLQRLVQEDIIKGIDEMLKKNKLQKENVVKIAIAGNTTMIQMLLGLSCSGLGRTPFISMFTSFSKFSFFEIFENNYLNCDVMLLPAISCFVGSDITAGLMLCELEKKSRCFMLLDIGTNGEMVLIKENEMLATSTAAGPAFEGGNIGSGTGSIPGAIYEISLNDGVFSYKTINDKEPVGICGTGIVDLLATLLDNEYIDETGFLSEDFPEELFSLPFSQKDIRQIQLAKSAIRSGIDCLLKAGNVEYSDIDTLYLAGGFGFKINIDSACRIGLLPKELRDKVSVIGNGSLGGCGKVLLNKAAEAKVKDIAANCKEINLADDKLFQQLFAENMYF